jgi:hypothetical protein
MEARLAKLEERVAASSTAPASPLPASTSQAVQQHSQMLTDLHLDFKAEVSDLPPLLGTPTDEQTASLDMLSTLFAASPWGKMPAITFQLLGAAPSFIHGMVGDKIWQACWKSRHTAISEDMFVPYQLMDVLKWIIQQRAATLTAEQQLEGQQRYHVAEEAATKREANAQRPF